MHAYPQPGGPQQNTASTQQGQPSAMVDIAAPTGNGYNLSAEEAALVLDARQAGIAMVIIGVVCGLTSWTWVGIIAGVMLLIVGVTLLQRMVDGNTVYNGHSCICCCCSTPRSQLDACSTCAIIACVFGVITIIVNVALVSTAYGVRQVLGIVSVVNALAAVGVVIASVIGIRATRAVLEIVYPRIAYDINHVVVVQPAVNQQQQQYPQQHQQQQQYPQQVQQYPQQQQGPDAANAGAPPPPKTV